MFNRWSKPILFSILVVFLFATMQAYAVKKFKISNYGDAHQVWFEVEDYDERNPDTDEHYPVVDKDDASGQAINRTGVGGGMIRYTFDISQADGSGGEWYFWARIINPNNTSDYLLVEGHPDDPDIPSGPPFPAGDGSAPFVNDDDRIFEENQGPPWAWGRPGHGEGHTKELQDGVNAMYIFHRQGDANIFWDTFMWTDSADYAPTDEDYQNAQPGAPVEPAGKLATVWGKIKLAR